MKSRHKQGMQQMLDEIEQEVRYTRRLIGKQAPSDDSSGKARDCCGH